MPYRAFESPSCIAEGIDSPGRMSRSSIQGVWPISSRSLLSCRAKASSDDECDTKIIAIEPPRGPAVILYASRLRFNAAHESEVPMDPMPVNAALERNRFH